MMTKRALYTLTLPILIAACGGGTTPPPQPPTANVPPVGPSKPDAPPLLIEYVVIHRKWVEKYVAAPAADVKTWSEATENAELVRGSVRQIMAKTKKGGQALAERLKKEDFAKVAKASSEDAATKDKGGELTNEALKELPQELRDAIASLKVGETSKEPVANAAGTSFFLFKKERLSDEQVERAYKKAKAPEVALKLAEDLQNRFKAKAETRPAIADAVQSVLGEGATNDVDRPRSSLVERERLKHVRMTAAAKAALETFAKSAHPGDPLPSPAVDADNILVARAVSPSATTTTTSE